MTLSTEGARGARRYVFNVVTLICDNDQGAYYALREAATGALLGLPGWTLAQYRELHAAGASDGAWWAVASAAGEAVAEEIHGWVAVVDGTAGMLLTDLLDLGDSTLWAEIGWHYLPEPDDMEAHDFDGFEEVDA